MPVNKKYHKASFSTYVFEIVRRLQVYYQCKVDYPLTENEDATDDGLTIHFDNAPCLDMFLSNWFLGQVRKESKTYVSASKTICKEIWENIRRELLTSYLYKPYLHEKLLREISTRRKKPFEDVMNRL